MRKLLKVFIVGGLSAMPTMVRAEGIPVVGRDAKGKEIQMRVSEKDYYSRLDAAFREVDVAMRQSLKKEAARPSAKFRLRTVVVGIGVGFSFGLGPIVNVNAKPRLRLVYSNSADPVMP